MSEQWINYAKHGGYSEHDGLGKGRWEPIPGTAGVQRWVGDLEPKIDKRRGRCVDCDGHIDQRSDRCRSCQGRAFNRKRWAKAQAAERVS